MLRVSKLTSLAFFLIIKRADLMKLVTALVLSINEIVPSLPFLGADFLEVACILSHSNLNVAYLHGRALAGIARVCLAVIAALHVRI